MLADWEYLILGILLILLIFWYKPGIKAAITLSKQTPADWPAILLPLGLVVLFVFLLIAMV